MSELKIEKSVRRGRPKRSEAERFQTMAWYNSVSRYMGTNSPYALECQIQPENIIKRHGKVITSRAWDRYKIGARTPQDGLLKDEKKFSAVVAAERHVPMSGDVFRNPIWHAMKAKVLRFDEAVNLIVTLKPATAHLYIDLSDEMKCNRIDSLFQNMGCPIWIERGDYFHALDHLAVNLIFLRLEAKIPSEGVREGIAENIAKSLGPISQSPWINPFFEEMFDWLERNVWGTLFDEFYTTQKWSNARGWRKTIPDWLIIED